MIRLILFVSKKDKFEKVPSLKVTSRKHQNVFKKVKFYNYLKQHNIAVESAEF